MIGAFSDTISRSPVIPQYGRHDFKGKRQAILLQEPTTFVVTTFRIIIAVILVISPRPFKVLSQQHFRRKGKLVIC